MNGVAFCLVGIPPLSEAKGRRDGMVSTNENRRRPLSSGEVEGVSWQGPRTVFVQKNSQGFGFTLRHFIVYPPESSLHTLKDEENGNTSRKGCQLSRLEPMDTIFVKSVKDQSPAQQAGLCTGDRLVKVNGETILGKTYSQVIALIQNSENILELSIMPKDEDVLQLVYSQDAYLKCSEPYGSAEQNFPEHPPLCCSSSKSNSATLQHRHSPHSPLDNCQCRTDSSSSQLDNRNAAAPTLNSGSPGLSADSGPPFVPARRHRSHSSSAINALNFHFANHNAAIASATLPPPRRSGLPASARAHADALCHQALSDWYYSQAEAAERMSPRHRSVSQDRLAELGLGLALGPAPPSSATYADQHRRETLLYHQQAAASSHHSHWLESWGPVAGPGSRSCSESLLAAYAEYEHNYGRSVETLAQASALVLPPSDHASQRPQLTKFTEQKELNAPGLHQHQATVTPPVPASSSTMSPTGWQPGQQVAEPQTRRVKQDEQIDYKRYSPSLPHKTSHLLQQGQPLSEPSYSSSHLNYQAGRQSSPVDGHREAAPRHQSSPAPPTSEEDRVRLIEDREATYPVNLHQEVVMRQKRPPGCRTSLQIQRSQTPVESPEHCGVKVSPENPSTVPRGTRSIRRGNGSLAQHAFDSLSSIPFIGSIKGRRSSYLLAITTERSKSCDEGLNTFREESRMMSKLPKRVKSFFTDGSLESLRAEEEARAKRHSTSELGTITLSDVRREGWLHYKQILTEKGKKVGGGIRPWKRAFSVLRSSSLFLYKDKREAVLHGASAGPSQHEHPPISIRGCLIDIAYSETKRKHTLRLTTQDFCEYLLQAEDREDMLAWIRVIRENSKTDNEEIGFTRQALINKKLNNYRKHSLTGNKPDSSPRAYWMIPPLLLAKTDNAAVNRVSRNDDNKPLWGINIMKKAKKAGSPKAFGVRLEDCQPAVNHKFVPLIVEMCCSVVEATGLEYTGIYRVPGNNAMVSHLQEHLNKGMDINTAEERWQDLNVISSLLKSFFRKLPEPLFTDDKYNEFIDANRIEDAEDRFNTMKKLIQDLPNHYYHTLKFLVGHLKKVADNAEKNKMEPRNLALVFGPTLVRTSEDNMTDMVTHMPDRYKIVETLIVHFDWFFVDGEINKDDKTPQDKGDVQPVPNIDHLLSNIGRPGMPGETSDSATSDSLKSKVSSSSKRDLNARDFLPKAILSAVTRKRKKCLSTYLLGSSADEDSEHEPVKASNYKEEGNGGEEDKEGRESESVDLKPIFSEKEQLHDKEQEITGGGNLLEKDVRNRIGRSVSHSQRETPQGTICPAMQHHSSSLRHSLCQIQATSPRLPPAAGTTFGSSIKNPAKRQPAIPLWISPNRPPGLIQRSTQQPNWNQSQPIHYRKTKSGRMRAVSLNLELELGRSEDRIRAWQTDKVEVVRVIEGPAGLQERAGVSQPSFARPGSLVYLPHDAPNHSSYVQAWTDQRSQEASAVVQRRSGQNPRGKLGAWRRHTVVV